MESPYVDCYGDEAFFDGLPGKNLEEVPSLSPGLPAPRATLGIRACRRHARPPDHEKTSSTPTGSQSYVGPKKVGL